jgi:hypothetical protein
MNLDRINSPISSAAIRSAGQRLDFTVSEPASPDTSVQKTATPVETGSIQGVLTDEENRAVLAMFTPRQGTYAPSGSSGADSIPGLKLDITA